MIHESKEHNYLYRWTESHLQTLDDMNQNLQGVAVKKQQTQI